MWRNCLVTDDCDNFTLCSEGSQGKLCATCADNYFLDGLECKKCDAGRNLFWILLSALFVGAMFIVCIFVKCLGRKPPAALTGPVSIGLNFWQLLGLFRSIRLDWPAPVRTMFSIVNLANLNMDVLQSQCAIPMTYFTKLHLIMAMPLSVWLFINIFVLAPLSVFKGKVWLKIISANVLWIIYSVSFVSVVKKAVEVFACAQSPDGTILMQKDPNVVCQSNAWWSGYALPALAWLCLYAALPLLITKKLMVTGEKIWSGERFTYRSWSGFYRKYKKIVYVWELAVLSRKAIAVGSVVLLNLYPFRACMMFSVTLIVCMFLNARYKPYEDCKNNGLEDVVLFSMALIAFSGIVFYAPVASETRYVPEWMVQIAIVIDLIAIGLASAIVVAVMFVSVDVVLFEESKKHCESDVRRNVLMLSPMFNEEAIHAVLFPLGNISLENTPAKSPPESEPAAISSSLVGRSNEIVHFVAPAGPGDEFSIVYRGVPLVVEWITPPLNIKHQSIVKAVQCDDSGVELVGGRVDLLGGMAFKNPPCELLAELTSSLMSLSTKMHKNSTHMLPEAVFNSKEPWRDAWCKRFFGVVVNKVVDDALGAGILRSNHYGAIINYPQYHKDATLVEAFEHLISLDQSELGGGKGKGRHSLTADGQESPLGHQVQGACKRMAERLNIEPTDEMFRIFEAIDGDSDGHLTHAEIVAGLKLGGHESTRERDFLLVAIEERYRQLLERDELLETLSSALYSLFLFVTRQMYTRERSIFSMNFGRTYQQLLLGRPLHSTLAQVGGMQPQILARSDRIGTDGPVEFTALWLDRKANDKERMLMLGFLELVSRLMPQKDDSPDLLLAPPLDDSEEDDFPDTESEFVRMSQNAMVLHDDYEVDNELGYDGPGLEMQEMTARRWPVSLLDQPLPPEVDENELELGQDASLARVHLARDRRGSTLMVC
jgi:hypothetical protein